MAARRVEKDQAQALLMNDTHDGNVSQSDEAKTFSKEVMKTLISLDMYYPRLEHVKVETIETMPIVELISNIGGTIGNSSYHHTCGASPSAPCSWSTEDSPIFLKRLILHRRLALSWALTLAASEGDTSTAMLIAESGKMDLDRNTPMPCWGQSERRPNGQPLEEAAAGGHWDLFHVLLQRTSDFRLRLLGHAMLMQTVIHESPNPRFLLALLGRIGSFANREDLIRRHFMSITTRCRRRAFLKAVLLRSAEPSRLCFEPTPNTCSLHYSLEEDNEPPPKRLRYSHSTNVLLLPERDSSFSAALLEAALRAGNLDLVLGLIRSRLVNLRSHIGGRLLGLALVRDRMDFFCALLLGGATTNAIYVGNCTLLHLAARKDYPMYLVAALDAGADLRLFERPGYDCHSVLLDFILRSANPLVYLESFIMLGWDPQRTPNALSHLMPLLPCLRPPLARLLLAGGLSSSPGQLKALGLTQAFRCCRIVVTPIEEELSLANASARVLRTDAKQRRRFGDLFFAGPPIPQPVDSLLNLGKGVTPDCECRCETCQHYTTPACHH